MKKIICSFIFFILFFSAAVTAADFWQEHNVRLGAYFGTLTPNQSLRGSYSLQSGFYGEIATWKIDQYLPRLYAEYYFFPVQNNNWFTGFRRKGILAIGVNTPFYIYGPRVYSLLLGYEFLPGYASGITQTKNFFGQVTYEEELTSNIFMRVYARLNLYVPNSTQIGLHPQIGFALSTHYDFTPQTSEADRIPATDKQAILAQNQTFKSDELVKDLSATILSFANLKQSSYLRVPKIIYKGVPFMATREFSADQEIIKVTCKIDGVADTLFVFEKKSPDSNIWQTEITIPEDFTGLKANFKIFYKIKDGGGSLDYFSALVE